MLGLFSERNKAKDIDEVFIFDELPKKLRVQFMFIVEDILDKHDDYYEFHKALCEEYGKITLNPKNSLGNFDKSTILGLLTDDDYDINVIFDIVELALRFHSYNLREEYKFNLDVGSEIMGEMIDKVNARFKESSVGYELVNYEIIRIDSEATFNEIIKPAINLTNNKLFENVNLEYTDAIKAYQEEDNEKCINKCSKAFESTMKIICDENGWNYNDKDTSTKLISICYENELIPKKLQSEFNSLRGLLESGIPPVRNHYSGHGKGGEKIVIEDYLARYALNITGSCIIFLIEISGL